MPKFADRRQGNVSDVRVSELRTFPKVLAQAETTSRTN
jgi:hypothetical protein